MSIEQAIIQQISDRIAKNLDVEAIVCDFDATTLIDSIHDKIVEEMTADYNLEAIAEGVLDDIHSDIVEYYKKVILDKLKTK